MEDKKRNRNRFIGRHRRDNAVDPNTPETPQTIPVARTASDFGVGSVVFVDYGEGTKLGLVYDLNYKNKKGETKSAVQVGSQVYNNLAYRAPKSRDKEGPGQTWWKLTDE